MSKQVNSAKSKDVAGNKKSTGAGAKSSKACDKANDRTSDKPVDADKFELYFDFKAYIIAIKPHQVDIVLYIFRLFPSIFLSVFCANFYVLHYSHVLVIYLTYRGCGSHR